MHELQLLQQVVRIVDKQCRQFPDHELSMIHLTIGSHSHLASHSLEELQDTFQFASKGTSLESATLKIHTHVTHGTCQSCHTSLTYLSDALSCSQCGSVDISWDAHPELVITGLEFLERTIR